MKKILRLFIVLSVCVLASCEGHKSFKNKKYSYVELIKEKDLLGSYYIDKIKDTVDIYAPNDSLAYIEAYEKYCISENVSKMMKSKGLEYTSYPYDFHLYDENGSEISPLIPNDVLSEIRNNIDSLTEKSSAEKSPAKKSSAEKSSAEKSSAEKSTLAKDNKSSNPVDSATIKKLSKLFLFNKDEFSPDNMTWIKPKSAPKYVNRNAMYCYFMSDDRGVSNFRFQVQYYADNWLFFYKCQFNIDGKAYEFTPEKTETDNGGGYIWEWFDEPIRSADDVALIKALASAKNARIKFIGRQYYKIKNISKSEIESIKNSLDLFIAMGGRFGR